MEISEIQHIKNKYQIIGNADSLNRAIGIAKQVGHVDLSVLITGESGVGKEIFPRIIHDNSIRKHNSENDQKGGYIAINCGAIPEGTIDSELFGHEKGSFTGALSERKGYFETANGGTIFLDEVGELPLSTQARLLRVLETGEFMRVGSSKVLKTDVRVIAATNVNLPDAVKKGKFREDLYYRLNTIPIYIPPLRERREDIPLLFRKFAVDFADKYKMPPVRLTPDAEELLCTYRFPGNVRQLKNITEQISTIENNRDIDELSLKKYLPEERTLPILSGTGGSAPQDSTDFNTEREILYKILFDMKKDMNDLKRLVYGMIDQQPADPKNTSIVLSHDMLSHPQNINPTPSPSFRREETILDSEPIVEESFSIEEKEKELIIKALEKNHNKRKLAAADLGISERTLYRKLKEYGIDS